MRNKRRLVCLLLVAVCAISCLLAIGGQAFAESSTFVGSSSCPTDLQQLFSETSTYNCTSAPTKNQAIKDEDEIERIAATTFNTTAAGKNSNTVKTGEPQESLVYIKIF